MNTKQYSLSLQANVRQIRSVKKVKVDRTNTSLGRYAGGVVNSHTVDSVPTKCEKVINVSEKAIENFLISLPSRVECIYLGLRGTRAQQMRAWRKIDPTTRIAAHMEDLKYC